MCQPAEHGVQCPLLSAVGEGPWKGHGLGPTRGLAPGLAAFRALRHPGVQKPEPRLPVSPQPGTRFLVCLRLNF